MRNPPVKNGTDTPLFGLFADLKNRPVLVVGGGQVAQRKVAALRAAGARVRVGAPELSPELLGLFEAGLIDFQPGRFQAHWLDDVWLAVAESSSRDLIVAVPPVSLAVTRTLWFVALAPSVTLPL